MTRFRVQVADEQQRRHMIDAECNATPNFGAFHHYRDAEVRLPIVRIPIALPLYRMANIRTRTRQLHHIRAERRDADWFRANQENNTAQQVQHEFLVELAQRGRAESITPIYDVLQSEGQTEDILITRSGVVVNGNRRLAAMRELHAEFPAKCASLSHVNALVLPAEALERDLQSIEFRLQMRPETKLPYEWVDEAIGVRDMKNSGFSNDEIAHLMRLDRDVEVDQIVTRLNEAEVYLAEYLREPQEYARVYDSRQMFVNWERALRESLRHQPNDVREGARAIAHVLTRQSRSLGERAHAYREAFGRDATEVLTRLERAYEHELAHMPAADGGVGDIFSEVAEAPTAATRVLPLLSNSARAEEMAQQITDIHDNITGERADERRGQEALRSVRKAHTALANVDLTEADPGTFADIRTLTTDIVTLSQRLLDQLGQRG